MKRTGTGDKYPLIYFWNRMGRKGQRCRVLARSKIRAKYQVLVLVNGKQTFQSTGKWNGGNSVMVEFEDGYTAITSGNALRRAKDAPV